MSKGTEYLLQIVNRGSCARGIPSICSSNHFVLKASLEYAKENNQFVLIEATANQVNQYGGYTGMRPRDFKNDVYELARLIGLAKEKIILGGDHLGPLIWKGESEEQALGKAQDLIIEYVKAGFEKIHIDTSMRLSGDALEERLTDEIISRRAARLCKVAEQAYQDHFGKESDLVYVVGSEVPVPGGAQSRDEELKVTLPSELESTMIQFKKAFKEAGIENTWNRVIAVVVQPGVEFSDDSVHIYDSENARLLTDKVKDYKSIVFEAHSTDYQTKSALKEMTNDGFGILKVGPELTFALREGLFALESIANELGYKSGLIDVLEQAMLANPSHWEKYYTGTDDEIAVKKKFSYSDRWRYYADNGLVKESINRLFEGLDLKDIPLTLFSQFLPDQYKKLMTGELDKKCERIVIDKVKDVLRKYYGAV